MIEAVCEWLTAVVAVMMLLSAILLLVPEGTIKKIAELTGGVLVMLALMTPVMRFSGETFRELYHEHQKSAEVWKREVEESEEQTLCDEVKARVAEYIETYSASQGKKISAEVTVVVRGDGVPVPSSVEISGEPDKEISEWIASELGISKEQQFWIQAQGRSDGD